MTDTHGDFAHSGGHAVAGEGGHVVELGQPLELWIHARDQAGRPLGGAIVKLVQPNTPDQRFESDRGGMVSPPPTVRPNQGLEVRAKRTRLEPATRVAVALPASSPTTISLRIPRLYVSRTPFPWQNPALRETMYRETGFRRDPGQDSGTRVRAGALPGREDRLRDFILGFAPIIGVPTSAGSLDAALAARVEPSPPAGREARVIGFLAEIDGELGTTTPSPTRRRALESRRTRLDDERTRLEGRRLAAAERATEAARRAAAEAGLDSMDHAALVRHMVELFEGDTRGVVPPWLWYMALHFSGIRYERAHPTYYPPQWLVFNLRERELASELSATGAPAGVLPRLLAEARLLLADPPTLAAVVLRWAPAGSAELRKPGRRLGRGGHGDPLAALERAGTDDEKRTVLRQVHLALAHHWCSNMSREEAEGCLVTRNDEGLLTGDPWALVVALTTLRNDFATDGSWDAGVIRPPRRIPAGAHERAAEREVRERVDALNDAYAGRRAATEAERDWLFRDGIIGAWRVQQGTDLSIAPSCAECNEITEMAAAARGLSLSSSGIAGDAASESLEAGGPSADGSTDAAEEEETEDGGSVLSPSSFRERTELRDGRRLWRPAHARDLQAGDIVCFMEWRRINPSDTRYSIVLPEFDLWLHDYAPALPIPESPDNPRTGTAAARTSLQEVGSDLVFRCAPGSHELPPAASSEQTLTLASAPTSYGGRMVVRRHPRATMFHEQLVWSHIATIAGVDGSHVYTFETNAPAGVKLDRPLGTMVNCWRAVFGRPISPPDPERLRLLLAPYLEPGRLRYAR